MKYSVSRAATQGPPALAKLIYESDRHFYDYVFTGPPNAYETITLLVHPQEGLFSAADVRIATIHDDILGLVLYYEADSLVQRVKSTVYRAKSVLEASSFNTFQAAINRVTLAIPPLIPGSIYLQNLAVGKHHRRMGIGSALFETARSAASSRANAMLSLDVCATNSAALAFYSHYAPVSLTDYTIPMLEDSNSLSYNRLDFDCG